MSPTMSMNGSSHINTEIFNGKRVLIVDDEHDICSILKGILDDQGFETFAAQKDEQAFELLRQHRPDIVVLDIWLEGSKQDGLQILEEVKREYPDLPVVMISGHGTIEAAVTAIKRGAYDFIEKPFKEEQLLLVLERALTNLALKKQVRELQNSSHKESELIGTSQVIQKLTEEIERVAQTSSRIFLHGPAGCGKEVCARMIHTRSEHITGPFITLNCSTIRSDKLEVELFGIEPSRSKEAAGSRRKIGAIERAHGGTLYLDGITNLPTSVQAKLLRVLQDKAFKRIGGNDLIPINTRIISSSNENVEQLIVDGKFRQDLYYRINVVELRMPSLAERRDDIPLLVKYFMKLASESIGMPTRIVSHDLMTALQTYDWPGNMRQFRAVIEWLLIMAPKEAHEPLKASLLPISLKQGMAHMGSPFASSNNDHADTENAEEESSILDLPLREARESFEREYLTNQVMRFGGNISRTAEFIGMERSALHRKLRTLGVNYQQGRGGGTNGTEIPAPVDAPPEAANDAFNFSKNKYAPKSDAIN